MKVTALAGGVGASKLLDGFYRVLPPEDLTAIVNTGDDIEMFGLYIAPDLDIVTYTLAGIVNPAMGWGIDGDSFSCLERLLQFAGGERWFNLGDRDLATHIFRTAEMKAGRSLTEVADRIRRTLGVRARILPMCDRHTPTTVIADIGEMHFQEYLIKHRAAPKIRGLRFESIESARPAPGVEDALLQAELIVICPSNPLISIGPILAVPGIRDMLKQTPATVVAVSPVVGGASLKGPTDRMLADLGMEVSAVQIAKLYADFANVFVLDLQDEGLAKDIEGLGLKVVVMNTVMKGIEEKVALSRAILSEYG
jgi:LPPG:FO 2-phospho-L-lactate transferase